MNYFFEFALVLFWVFNEIKFNQVYLNKIDFSEN